MPLNLKSIFSAGAEKLVTAVGNAFDQNFSTKEEKEAAKLAMLQEINRHLESVQADATKQIEMENADRASARTRESDFVKATGHIDWMQTAVGIFVMVAFIGSLLMIGFHKLPEGSEHLMINAIGILEGLVLAVVGYYYGSSAGSRIKDMKGK